MSNRVLSATFAATLALGAPTATYAQGMPQMLQGLMTGNQNQDKAVREAYERGYQKGRQDEAQLSRSRRPGDRGNDYRQEDDRPNQAPYDPRQNDYRR